MPTRREEMAELLMHRPYTPKELAEYFEAEINEIVEDIVHVKRSVQPPLKFMFIPSICRNCGFKFRERSRIKTPSKCPKCRHEAIDEAKYFIKKGG